MRTISMVQLKDAIEADQWVVSHHPRVTVRIDELIAKEVNFNPREFSLPGIQLKILVEAEGTGENLEHLLSVLHDPLSDVPSPTSQLPVRVVVRNALGLRNEAWMGKSDPYCICEIPGKPAASFQTKVVKNNMNPVWNHADEVYGYSPGDSLAFSVWDRDAAKRDDLLGRGTLTSDQVLAGFEGVVTLTDVGHSRKASLYVKVTSPRGDARISAVCTADMRRSSGFDKVEVSVKGVESEVRGLSDPMVRMVLGEAISCSVSRFACAMVDMLEDQITVPKP